MDNDSFLMTEGSIARKLIVFSIPLVLGNLLQQLYNTADSIFIGNFVGPNALAAVGSSTSMINLVIAFSQGAATGAGVVVAQHLGACRKKELHDSVHTSFALAFILGIILSLVGIALSAPLLRMMGTPAEVFPESDTYLKVYFAGVIFNVLYNMAASILNATGNSKRSLLYLGVASITNIMLDLVLICVFSMGVAGAAIATTFSQLLSSVLAIRYLCKTKSVTQLTLREIGFKGGHMRRIIAIGLPTGIQTMVISLSNLLLQSSVNQYGAAAMAGYGSYLKVDGFNILPILSISMAMTTFVGQNFGAGKVDRIRKGIWIGLAMCCAYCVMTGILILTFQEPIMQLFSSDPDVIAYGTLAMHYFCPFYCLLAIMHVLAGSVRGTGKSMPPMLIMLFAMCIFRIFWVQFILPGFDSIRGIFMVYPVSWSIGMLLSILYTWKGKWLPSTIKN